MLRLLIGLALAPTAALFVAAAVRALWGLLGSAPSVYPFAIGVALPVLARIFIDLRSSRLGRALTVFYVYGHELTHALAAWMGGGKVFSLKAGVKGGHVDVSHTSTFASLAPYCIPLPTIIVVFGYRLWSWARPAGGGEPAFLILMGVTLSFHLLATFECLWNRRQPDLDAAGGAVFSLAVIVMANALCFLLLLKVLFPRIVSLAPVLHRTFVDSAAFWEWAVRMAVSWTAALLGGRPEAGVQGGTP